MCQWHNSNLYILPEQAMLVMHKDFYTAMDSICLQGRQGLSLRSQALLHQSVYLGLGDVLI